MSLFSAITDYFTTDTSKTQTFNEAQANTARLNQLLADQGRGGQQTLDDPGAAANSAFLASLTGGVLGTPDPNDAEAGKNSTGFAAVFKDVLILVAIGGAIYLFVKLGGIEKLKRLAS